MSNVTSVTLDAFPEHVKAVLKAEARALIEDPNNREDVAELGEDLVELILLDKVFSMAPIPIPEDFEGANMAYLAAREKIITARDQAAQLVAKAQKEHTERVQRLQAAAGRAATKVAGLLSGFALSGLGAVIGL